MCRPVGGIKLEMKESDGVRERYLKINGIQSIYIYIIKRAWSYKFLGSQLSIDSIK